MMKPSCTKGKVHRQFKGAGVKVFERLELMFPDNIIKNGSKFSFEISAADFNAMKSAKAAILKAIGGTTASVSNGRASEDYEVDPEVLALEDDRERLTFEKQLEDRLWRV
jgi:hypothetical protein